MLSWFWNLIMVETLKGLSMADSSFANKHEEVGIMGPSYTNNMKNNVKRFNVKNKKEICIKIYLRYYTLYIVGLV